MSTKFYVLVTIHINDRSFIASIYSRVSNILHKHMQYLEGPAVLQVMS